MASHSNPEPAATDISKTVKQEDSNRQALHDKAAHTVVLDLNGKRRVEHAAQTQAVKT
jgi:hypothetical protein